MKNNSEGVVRNSDEIEIEAVPDADKIGIRWIISSKDGSDRIQMRKFTLLSGADMPAHSHPNTEHVQYYLKGEVTLMMGAKEYKMKAGDSAFIPPGVIHKYSNHGDTEAEFLCMVPGGEIKVLKE